MSYQTILEELRRVTNASRTTLRLEQPGGDFPVVAEALAARRALDPRGPRDRHSGQRHVHLPGSRAPIADRERLPGVRPPDAALVDGLLRCARGDARAARGRRADHGSRLGARGGRDAGVVERGDPRARTGDRSLFASRSGRPQTLELDEVRGVQLPVHRRDRRLRAPRRRPASSAAVRRCSARTSNRPARRRGQAGPASAPWCHRARRAPGEEPVRHLEGRPGRAHDARARAIGWSPRLAGRSRSDGEGTSRLPSELRRRRRRRGSLAPGASRRSVTRDAMTWSRSCPAGSPRGGRRPSRSTVRDSPVPACVPPRRLSCRRAWAPCHGGADRGREPSRGGTGRPVGSGPQPTASADGEGKDGADSETRSRSSPAEIPASAGRWPWPMPRGSGPGDRLHRAGSRRARAGPGDRGPGAEGRRAPRRCDERGRRRKHRGRNHPALRADRRPRQQRRHPEAPAHHGDLRGGLGPHDRRPHAWRVPLLPGGDASHDPPGRRANHHRDVAARVCRPARDIRPTRRPRAGC